MSKITVKQVSEYTKARDIHKKEQLKRNVTDIVMYGKVHDLNDVANCDAICNMEEWVVGVEKTGSIGNVCLLITNQDNEEYTLLTWYQADNHRPCVVETPLSNDAYEQLKRIGINGYAYRRHRLDIAYTNNAWFVDVFKAADGQDHPWVRVTLSVQSQEDEIPTLPITFDEIIAEDDPNNSEETNAFIKRLWRHDWVSLNIV